MPLRPQRIALFQMDDGHYQRLLREECLREARRHDFQVRAFSADNDSHKQVEQINACLKEPEATRPTAILVVPVAAAPLLPAASPPAQLAIAQLLLARLPV